MSGESTYELTLSMSKDQLKCLYVTMTKAYKNWPGGEPFEQEILLQLRDETWKLMLESQFPDG